MAENNLNKNGRGQKPKANIIKELAPYTTLGIQLVLTIVLGAYIGWLIDDKFETAPIFLIVLTFFGAFAGMVTFIKTVLKRSKKKNK
ncbi:AtpZ/AtpI family protein [Bacteroidota bacterium]